MSQLHTCRGAVATNSGHTFTGGTFPPAAFGDQRQLSANTGTSWTPNTDRRPHRAALQHRSATARRSTNRSLVSTSRTRRRSQSVSFLTSCGAACADIAVVGAEAAARRRVAVERTIPVNTATCLSGDAAGDQRHVGFAQRFLRCSSESALSERVAKRLCAFPVLDVQGGLGSAQPLDSSGCSPASAGRSRPARQ